MKFYHGTSEENWEAIKKEGVLFGKHESYRYTYLTPNRETAERYGDVVLEVEYEPRCDCCDDNYIEYCSQFSVFVPIALVKIKRLLNV